MNILIINTYYYPNLVGGCEHSVKLLAEGLARNNHNVSVYTIDNLKTKKMYMENIDGIKVYRGYGGVYDIKAKLRINKNPARKLLNKFIEINNRSSIKEISEVIGKENPDIIHTNNLYGISFAIWRTINFKGIPIVHSIRDYWLLSPTYSLKYSEKGVLINLFHKVYQSHYRALSKYVTVASAPSSFTLNKYIEYGYFMNADHISVNNCIEAKQDKVNQIIEYKNGIERKKIVFLYIGSLIEIKGIRTLLHVFNSISNKDIQLNICGSGPLESMVNSFIKVDKRIRYFGQVSVEQRDEIMRSSDVLIIPSNFEEPFGRVVIEGNYAGLPVIGSNKGGIPEIISNIHTGEVYNTEEELKNLIIKFSNRNVVKSYYDAIRTGIMEYSQEKQIDKFISIYERIINV